MEAYIPLATGRGTQGAPSIASNNVAKGTAGSGGVTRAPHLGAEKAAGLIPRAATALIAPLLSICAVGFGLAVRCRVRLFQWGALPAARWAHVCQWGAFTFLKKEQQEKE